MIESRLYTLNDLDRDQREAYHLLMEFRFSHAKALDVIQRYRSALIIREAGKLRLYREAPSVAIVLERLIDRANWQTEEIAGRVIENIAEKFMAQSSREAYLQSIDFGKTQLQSPTGSLMRITGMQEDDLLVEIDGVVAPIAINICQRYPRVEKRHIAA